MTETVLLNKQLIIDAHEHMITPDNINQIRPLVDFTRLKENDDEKSILQFCLEAHSSPIPVACLCVYPEFLAVVKQNSSLNIATSCNFPDGNLKPDEIHQDIAQALALGADEIDLVLPDVLNLALHRSDCLKIIEDAKKQIGSKVLKVILETALWPTPESLFQIAQDVIKAGADFVKTSTGKREPGATLESALILLYAIQATKEQGYDAGLKASGGIRTAKIAYQYLFLAESMMGKQWINPHHFRIGTSVLI